MGLFTVSCFYLDKKQKENMKVVHRVSVELITCTGGLLLISAKFYMMNTLKSLLELEGGIYKWKFIFVF